MEAIFSERTTLLANATSETFTLERAYPGETVRVKHFSCTDQDNAPTSIELGLQLGGRYHGLVGGAPSAANISVSLNGGFLIPPNARLYARVRGGTLSDTIKVTMLGETIGE